MTKNTPRAMSFEGILVNALLVSVVLLAIGGWAAAQGSSAAALFDQAKALADDPEQAIVVARQARTAAREANDSRLEARAILMIAGAHKKMKEYDLADDACLEALRISRIIRYPDNAFDACDLASKMHFVRGRYDLAQLWEERTQEVAREFDDRSQEAQSFNDLGVLLKRQGLIPQARENYQRALEIRRLLGDRRGEAQSLMNLGIIYKNLGDFPRALEYQLEALTIREELGDDSAIAQSYQNIGNLRGHLGDFEKAVDYYRRSLDIHRRTGNHGGIADALSNLSEAYSNLGMTAEALASIEEALEQARDAGDIPAVAGCLRQVGEYQAEMGELVQAENTLSEAVVLSRQTRTRRTEASALLSLGKTRHKAGLLKEAEESLRQAATVAEEIGELPTQSKANGELAPVLAEMGRHADAYDAITTARNIDSTMDQSDARAAVENLQARYDLQSKDNQIALLQRDNQIQNLRIARQRWLGGFVIMLLALVVAVAVAGWSRSQTLKKSHRLLQEKNDEIVRQQANLEAVNNALETAARKVNTANEALLTLSKTDSLTGLHNRKHVIDSLDNEVRRARRHHHDLAVLMIDLDHFKSVNDRFGHREGDTVLERISAVMKRTLRGEDMIGRYGGEEFLVVLPATDMSGAAELAERIRSAVEAITFDSDLSGLRQTISVGVAELTGCELPTAEHLLRLADSALYEAKNQGRNRIVAA